MDNLYRRIKQARDQALLFGFHNTAEALEALLQQEAPTSQLLPEITLKESLPVSLLAVNQMD